MEDAKEFTKPVVTAPDGGTRAWFHVFLCHMVFFNTWGVVNSYGVFQQYYTETLGSDASSIAWIGGIPMFLLFFGGVFSGRASDAGYFRHCFVSGVFLQVLGMMLTSLTTEYYQVLLTQGLCVGLGNALLFTPALSVASSYFKERRALAVGLAASGAATGGMLYPGVVNALLYHSDIGYPWTMRIIAFIMLTTHIPSIIGYRPLLPKRSVGPIIDLEAFKSGRFVFFAFGFFLHFWGLYMAFFFLGTFAKEVFHFENTLNLIIILNGVGVIGRILPNLIGERYVGGMNIIIMFSLASALCVYLWAIIGSRTGLYIWVVIYGIVGGGMQALFPAQATQQAPEPDKVGTWTGMVLTIVSFACLTAAPIQGALIRAQDGSYLGAQMFSATSIILGGLCLVASRWCRVGWKIKVKV
jgi:MFS family permease